MQPFPIHVYNSSAIFFTPKLDRLGFFLPEVKESEVFYDLIKVNKIMRDKDSEKRS